jgi:hypothetical protein
MEHPRETHIEWSDLYLGPYTHPYQVNHPWKRLSLILLLLAL